MKTTANANFETLVRVIGADKAVIIARDLHAVQPRTITTLDGKTGCVFCRGWTALNNRWTAFDIEIDDPQPL